MNTKIPTAKEILSKQGTVKSPISGLETYLSLNAEQAMVEFAKLHVKAALKAASEKGEVYVEVCMGQRTGATWVDEESILNSYPLTNIV